MRYLSVMALLVPIALAHSEEPMPKLFPGMKAPKIEVAEWVKQGPMKLGKGIRVVEFWATWCQPCRKSIPHLTELAKKYKGKVEFAGISIWEQEKTVPEIKDKVGKFVADMGTKMDYHVAIDTADKKMAQNWMAAAEQNGIPSSFIVDKKGVIVWIGHPMDIEKPLEEAINGKLDPKVQKTEFMKQIVAQRNQQKMYKEMNDAVALAKSGKLAEADQALAAISTKYPEGADLIKEVRLMRVYKVGSPEFNKAIDGLLAGNAADLSLAARVAWERASEPEGKEVCASIAKQVLVKTEDSVVCYYCASAALAAGDKALATEAADKGLAVLDKDPRKAQLDGLKEAFDKVKEAAAK